MQAVSNLAQKAMVVHPEYKPQPGDTMQALVWFGKKDVQIIQAPIPDITEPDDVIVRVTGCTICDSDLHLYHGRTSALKKGDILGHEFVGVVSKVGPNVQRIKRDERVVASFQIACGECDYCRQKLSSFCHRTKKSSVQNYLHGQRDAGFFGYSHFTGGFPGGQAEYVCVPKGDVNLLQIPPGVPDEKVLYLSEVLPTSYHAVVDTGVKEGNVVGIWDVGPIGLCVAQWALLRGASKVILIDGVESRLEYAKEKLRVEKAEQVETVNFETYSDVPKRIQELVPRGLDVAIDCGSFQEPKTLLHKIQMALTLETDVPETINEMLISLREVGRCGVIGNHAGYANGVKIGEFMEKGIRMIGNGQAPVHLYWEEILEDYIVPGKFDPTFMITHRFPLEDLPKVYKLFDERKAGIEKVFIQTQYSNEPTDGPQLSRAADLGV